MAFQYSMAIRTLRKDLHLKDINTNISSMEGVVIKAIATTIKCLWHDDSSEGLSTLSFKNHIKRFASF